MAGLASLASLLLLGFLSRLLTFAMNTLLARSLGPRWFAFSQLQLPLLTSTSLFLAKEGTRRAAIRMAHAQHAALLGWLAVPVTFISVACISFYSIWQVDAEMASDDSNALMGFSAYCWAVGLMALAAVVEACAEPAWIFTQTHDFVPERARMEGVALTLRVLLSAWLALHLQLGAIAFATAQLLSSAAYAALMWRLVRRRAPAAALRPARSLPPSERALAWQVCAGAMQKYALTEGERVVLVATAALDDQGVFALVSNLGSLVARIVLAPAEELLFSHFSRRAARLRGADGGGGADGCGGGGGDGCAVDASGAAELCLALRGAALFGLLFVAFGPAYSWLLLRLLYGAAWADGTRAPSLLGLYCVHVCLMSVNGVAEAFVSATASPQTLARLARTHTLLSAVYLAAAAAGSRTLGVHGLVLANGLNMAMRIGAAIRLIRRALRHAQHDAKHDARHEARHDAKQDSVWPPRLLPSALPLLSLAVAAAVVGATRLSFATPDASAAARAAHVAIGAAMLAAVGAAVRKGEPQLTAEIRRALTRPRRERQTAE